MIEALTDLLRGLPRQQVLDGVRTLLDILYPNPDSTYPDIWLGIQLEDLGAELRVSLHEWCNYGEDL